MVPSPSDLSSQLLNEKLLFSTPFAVDPADQKQLIDLVIREGDTLPPEGDQEPFWIGMGVTDLANPALLKDVAPENHGWWFYLSRLDESIEWVWRDLPATPIVQRILLPLEPYFKRFTRVSLVIQIPGRAIPAHRDIVVGDEYDNMLSPHDTYTGNQRFLFKGKEWFHFDDRKTPRGIHKSQHYLNLKIPLSQEPASPGRPFIRKNGEKIFYSSRNHALFLNEALVEHGADPCPFYRGVIFVDGLFNIKAFENLPRTPIDVLRVEAAP